MLYLLCGRSCNKRAYEKNYLSYSASYTSSAMAQSDAAVQQSQQLSQSANEMQDAIMSSWESRNTSQDIISQKQSDAGL